MTEKTRSYVSSEYKREAVRQLMIGKKSGADIARELGVNRNKLYKWKAEIDKFGDDAFPGKGQRPQQKDETTKLKREIKRLQEENEILKKAATYFAQIKK
jgi:transposase